MGLIVILTAATAPAMLGFILSHPKIEEDWRDQAEGLRQRREDDYFGAKTIAPPIMPTTHTGE